MTIIRKLDELQTGVPSVLTMGTFDGLHLGHRSLIEEVVKVGKEKGLRTVLLTFDPHPREIVRKESGTRLFLLMSIEERLEQLEQCGIDVCIVLPFTRELSLLTAQEFFDNILAGAIEAEHIIVGEDHAFGRGREGTAEALKIMSERRGIVTEIFGKLELGGQKISSSVVRRALFRGDVKTAAQNLGTEYILRGIVVKGDGLGHKMGFPTANIEVTSPKKLIPASGVYAVRVRYKGQEYTGMMNIGKKPTVSTRDKIWLEVHIFEFGETVYGEYISVYFVERIRDERKFRSRDELVKQLQKDVIAAKELLSEQSQ